MEHERDTDSNNNMAEKVINRLNNILQQSSILEDFSIIPSPTNGSDRNVSPVQYIESEHCLGLESWCVTHIFKYSQQQVLKLRQNVLRKPMNENITKLNKYLNVALLIQPEVNTFWNIKRELYKHLDHAHEMHFSKLVLSHKPKSLQTYTYRTWLINKLHVNEYGTILESELIVNNKAVVNCSNNYHAWNHRIWCMEHLLTNVINSNVILNELQYSVDFISTHVSEHSGFHYRQYVLRQFKQRFFYPNEQLIQLTQFFNIDDCCRVEQYFNQLGPKPIPMYKQYVCLLLHELFEVCKQLNVHFPAHEAIWYHRRFILHELIMLIHSIYGISNCNLAVPMDVDMNTDRISCNNDNCTKLDSNMGKDMCESVFYKNLVLYERDFLILLGKNYAENVCEQRLIKRHEKWLRFILNIDIDADVIVNNGEILFKV